MSDDVHELVKAAQKERASLVRKVATLERRISPIRQEIAEHKRRIAEIDTAFEPLRHALGKSIPHSGTPPRDGLNIVRPGQATHRSMVARVAEAIGRRGLDEFDSADIQQATGASANAVRQYLAAFEKAGKIHRVRRGYYRVQEARVA